MPDAYQAVAEIWPKLSKCTHCLGITWNAQATTDTSCNDNGRCASSLLIASSYLTRDAKFRPGGPAGPKIRAGPDFLQSPD